MNVGGVVMGCVVTLSHVEVMVEVEWAWGSVLVNEKQIKQKVKKKNHTLRTT